MHNYRLLTSEEFLENKLVLVGKHVANFRIVLSRVTQFSRFVFISSLLMLKNYNGNRSYQKCQMILESSFTNIQHLTSLKEFHIKIKRKQAGSETKIVLKSTSIMRLFFNCKTV